MQQSVVPQLMQQPVAQNPPAQLGQLKKRRKKKPAAAVGAVGGGTFAPQPTVQGMMQDISVPVGMVSAPTVEVVPVPQQLPTAAPVAAAPVVKPKKVGRCWKCADNTHATKNCKVLHYCLVCDSGAHPTIRCPVLKTPKPMSSFVGCGNDATLDLQIPDSLYKPQLSYSGAPTTLVQVSGEGNVAAADVQSLLARMCPGNPTWKWEAVPHGNNAYLIALPTAEDLLRIDGMQMSVPKINA
jgi:hypothetical protein